MCTCQTRLQRSKSSYLKPERKYFTVFIRVLLSMAIVLSSRGTAAFLSSSLDWRFPTKLSHKFRVEHHFKDHRLYLSSSKTSHEQNLLRAEGLFAVDKPLEWTSSDVVNFIRGVLEKEARSRGMKVDKINARGRSYSKRNIVKCGHGGTLDPLATGVLVIGVGSGTKVLQDFLKGTKGYRAAGEFGFGTDTLDMAGNVVKKAEFDHITRETFEKIMPQFVGNFLQYPPVYSALHKDGVRLHELARQGFTAEELDIPPREVTVLNFDLLSFDLPKFEIAVQCGSGTYIRSLIRDIGYSLDTVATTTLLQRTKQGPFTLEHALQKEQWTADNIYEAIERTRKQFGDNVP